MLKLLGVETRERRERGTGREMIREQKIIKAKVGLLELAKQLGNVS